MIMMGCINFCSLLCLSLTLLAGDNSHASDLNASPVRQGLSLNGTWQFQRDGEKQWKQVTVPSPFESHEGEKFDGIGWYRKEISVPEVPQDKRLLLHFQAAATLAEVWFDRVRMGSHLGAWTPFYFDITELSRQQTNISTHEIKVRLDEKVGHNTQGFLPIIAPHFGGIWQDVKLCQVPQTYIDEQTLYAAGNISRSRLEIGFALKGDPASFQKLGIRYRLRGASGWNMVSILPQPKVWEPSSLIRTEFAFRSNIVDTGYFITNGHWVEAAVPVPDFKLWSPTEPNLYEIEVFGELCNSSQRIVNDQVTAKAAFRSIEVFGSQLRLNGKPLNIRGLLNWGYYPPLTAPVPDEHRFRKDLELTRSMGFNLMKFCLWIPPKRYLELADEYGVLTWMEYPTWHPKLTPEYLKPLRQEFLEFFLFDRNHPSVILRSLTCETGAGADLKVINELYQLGHNLVPGAVIEDDSSWIGWNRIHDFYDDHPYGNNHTWVNTLHGFNQYILEHGLKPMMLGEAIAADTWLERDKLDKKVGESRPFWVPQFFDASRAWHSRIGQLYGPEGLDSLTPDSLRYAMLMRKYQMETFRREIPYGGFVVSVMRDFSTASMGMLDYLDQPKWSLSDWAWNRDTLCLLKIEQDRRSFFSNEPIAGSIWISHFGNAALDSCLLTTTLESPNGDVVAQTETKGISLQPGTLAEGHPFQFRLQPSDSPAPLLVRSVLHQKNGSWTNQWPIWQVPPKRLPSLPLRLHSSIANNLENLNDSKPWDAHSKDFSCIVVASRWDDNLTKFVEEGGRLLFLPDGQKGSFPLNAHWFLRGAPYIPQHALSPTIPRNLLVELQHFDLAGDVIPDIGYLESIDPILMLWDNHDLKIVKNHGLAFETRAGEGRILVSALQHGGKHNAAGRWLLNVFQNHLSQGTAPNRALSNELWNGIKEKLHEEKQSLTDKEWDFKPDPNNIGLEAGWQEVVLKDAEGWKKIRVGLAWESQGFPNLDKWAWYRLTVAIPEQWMTRNIYLSFEGVDDIYELYVNGQLAGKGGDLATRKDAFNEKKSHNIRPFLNDGKTCTIAVRVHDWYGAGGIFRPVTLGTARIDGLSETIIK